jgi:hypothetical protein
MLFLLGSRTIPVPQLQHLSAKLPFSTELPEQPLTNFVHYLCTDREENTHTTVLPLLRA